MIAIDSSAVIAIVRLEPGYQRFVRQVELAGARLMSAANYLECAIVLTRYADGRQELDEWIDHFALEIVPVDFVQARLAADAFVRFGRGQHPARLNYGDCFAYALASSRAIPLLYKGLDFSRIDVLSVLPLSP